MTRLLLHSTMKSVGVTISAVAPGRSFQEDVMMVGIGGLHEILLSNMGLKWLKDTFVG